MFTQYPESAVVLTSIAGRTVATPAPKIAKKSAKFEFVQASQAGKYSKNSYPYFPAFF